MAHQNSHSGVNGHASYGSAQNHQEVTPPAGSTHQGSLTTSHVDPTHQEHSQIETVGWAFVQQYYLTMGSNPHRLEHFYSKASSQTWGEETRVVTTTVGRTDIAKRFQEIGFKDAKVRLTNVDCQGTVLSSILVQVVGEFSNDNQGSRKFVQTFVLVPQKPEGYFVMNDVLRYLVDDIVIEDNATHYESEVAPGLMSSLPGVTGAQDVHTEGSLISTVDEPSTDVVTPKPDESLTEHSLEKSEAKLDEQLEDRTRALKINGHADTEGVDPPSSPLKNDTREEKAEELTVEKSPAPIPSPITAPTTKAPSNVSRTPEPTKPAGPKTWASLVAGPRPAIPAMPTLPKIPSQRQVPRISQPANHRPAHTNAPNTASPTAPAQSTIQVPPSNESVKDTETELVNESPAQRSQANVPFERNPEIVSAYIKHVSPNVNHEELKQRLSSYGEITNFYVHSQKVRHLSRSSQSSEHSIPSPSSPSSPHHPSLLSASSPLLSVPGSSPPSEKIEIEPASPASRSRSRSLAPGRTPSRSSSADHMQARLTPPTTARHSPSLRSPSFPTFPHPLQPANETLTPPLLQNCAFVEFASQQSFRAAMGDNPHLVSGERVIVDERRFKHGNGQFGPYQGGGGGNNMANRSRGGGGGYGSGGPNGYRAPFPQHDGMLQGRGGYNTLPDGEDGQNQYPINRNAFGGRGRGNNNNMRGRGGGRGAGAVGIETR